MLLWYTKQGCCFGTSVSMWHGRDFACVDADVRLSLWLRELAVRFSRDNDYGMKTLTNAQASLSIKLVLIKQQLHKVRQLRARMHLLPCRCTDVTHGAAVKNSGWWKEHAGIRSRWRWREWKIAAVKVESVKLRCLSSRVEVGGVVN